MTLEELKELVKPLLSGIVSGEIPENAEEIIQNIIVDYSEETEETEETEDAVENEWKTKYDNLLEKYTDRFLNGEETEEPEEPEEPEDEKTETIDTIFEKEESED